MAARRRRICCLNWFMFGMPISFDSFLRSAGLGWPRARVRRLRYFCAHTWVGEHALVFHGNVVAMHGAGKTALR